MWRTTFALLLLTAAAEAQYAYPPYGPPTTATTPAASGAASAAADAANVPARRGPTPLSALIAHVTLGALATMLILPLGAMVARSRSLTRGRGWFPAHAGVQVLGVACVVSAFGIAWSRFSRRGLDTPHRKAGVAVFSLVLFQALLGLFVHFLRPRLPFHPLSASGADGRVRGRGVSNIAHWVLGLSTIGVGWAAAWLGLTTEWERRGHGRPAYGWRVGWGVVVGLWILLYALGMGLLPRQLRREREAREGVEGHAGRRRSGEEGLVYSARSKESGAVPEDTLH